MHVASGRETCKADFFEFKIVQNKADRHYLNNWVVIKAAKQFKMGDAIEIHPQTLTKDLAWTSYKVYTLDKYCQRSSDMTI